MRKFLSLMVMAATLVLASCEPDPVELSFDKSVNVLLADAPLEVTLTAALPVAEAGLTVPVNISGSAVKGEEYEISASEFVFKPSATSAILTITPKNNFSEDKDIVLSLGALPEGYVPGVVNQTVIAVEGKELITYSFTAEKGDVLDRYVMSIELTGSKAGKDFTVTEDVEIPFILDPSSTAVEGEDFEIEGGVKKFVVKKGTNKGSVTILTKDVEIGSDKTLIVSVDKNALSARYLQGNIPTTTLAIKGILSYSSLVGEWEFVQIPGLEELELWVMEMEDDPELCPFSNDGYRLSFEALEDGGVKLIPGNVKGDLSTFFRTSTLAYGPIKNTVPTGAVILSENCTMEPNMWTLEEMYLTYFSIDPVNRAFSSETETLGASTVAMRINDSGNLEIHLRDYDEPPFMFMWWDPEEWDSDMFGFCYEFKRVTK